MKCDLVSKLENSNKFLLYPIVYIIITTITFLNATWLFKNVESLIVFLIINGIELSIIIAFFLFKLTSCHSSKFEFLKRKPICNTNILTNDEKKKYFRLRFIEEIERSRRFKFSSCILKIKIMDFDNMYKIYGKNTAQLIIDEVEKVLGMCKRSYDPVYLDNINEFILLCTHINYDDSIAICNRLLEKINKYPVVIRLNTDSVMPNTINIPIIISAVEYDTIENQNFTEILEQLDRLLENLTINTYNIVKYN